MCSCVSGSPERDYQEDSFSAGDPGSLTSSLDSHPLMLTAGDPREPDLSDDEGLPPEQPAFTGLFPPALFKSLLFKAVNTAQLGSNPVQSGSTPSQASLDPVFAEPTQSVDSVPVPPLFLDVVRRQWSSPGSVPVPSSTASISTLRQSWLLFSKCLQWMLPWLPSSASSPRDPEEGLRPEEHRLDQVLQRAHQGAAWRFTLRLQPHFSTGQLCSGYASYRTSCRLRT